MKADINCVTIWGHQSRISWWLQSVSCFTEFYRKV